MTSNTENKAGRRVPGRVRFLVLILAVAVTATFAIAAPKQSGSSAGGNDQKAIELLEQIEARHGRIQSVAGAFRQVKSMAMAPKPIESVARFYMQKPSKFRADYNVVGKAGQPKPNGPRYDYSSTNLIVDNEAMQYVRDLNQVSKYRFRQGTNVRDLNYLLLGFGEHTANILKVYNVTSAKAPSGYRAVVLTPRNKADAGFDSITMVVTDDAEVLPAQFKLKQGGDTTEVAIDTSSLQVGAAIPGNVFQANFPAGHETVRF